MCLDLFEAILARVAEPFDKEIEAKGKAIDAPGLDALEAIHFRRAGALAAKAFEIGIEIGLVVRKFQSQVGISEANADLHPS